jgi:hypothetical protein
MMRFHQENKFWWLSGAVISWNSWRSPLSSIFSRLYSLTFPCWAMTAFDIVNPSHLPSTPSVPMLDWMKVQYPLVLASRQTWPPPAEASGPEQQFTLSLFRSGLIPGVRPRGSGRWSERDDAIDEVGYPAVGFLRDLVDAFVRLRSAGIVLDLRH